ncbi:chorismate mutase [Ferrithrix thermotolerans DSM 19514]|uniref:Prephenate dehydratase n=1 Tax=Ferrithrix thermotolerans DSM 19514 TaxID=1121881 RepID=A0A1M4XXI4_9ACTN|nr:chorismate mutase [Ferrithrix thermotolerans DSM 19514]
MKDDTLICFLGPLGTSDHRAIELFSDIGVYVPLPMASISEIVQTVNYTPGCLGVVPLENSTDGELTTISDKLIFEATDIRIQQECVLAEVICAYGLADLSVATTVISHPQILDLCSRFIKERGLSTRHATSTTEACRLVAREKDVTLIALAPPAVGQKMGLSAFDDTVLDVPEIRTRYVLIGQGVAPATGFDKSVFVVTPAFDAAGALSDVLSSFTKFSVNMLSILSRPLQTKIGLHSFYITCEGHVNDTPILYAVESLLERGHSVKHLGSFPRWKGAEVTAPFANLPLGSIDPEDLNTKSVRELLGV